jgi:tRNA(fMet)-specific endonuclease VapC
MIFLPDTNAFSAYLAGRSKPLTERFLAAFAAGELRLSVMVLAELEFGAEKARRKLGDTRFARRVEQLRKQIELEPMGASFPRWYATVRAGLEAEGKKIGDRDTIIAAHALSLGAVMVTANVGEFSRIEGLVTENWELGTAGSSH